MCACKTLGLGASQKAVLQNGEELFPIWFAHTSCLAALLPLQVVSALQVIWLCSINYLCIFTVGIFGSVFITRLSKQCGLLFWMMGVYDVFYPLLSLESSTMCFSLLPICKDAYTCCGIYWGTHKNLAPTKHASNSRDTLQFVWGLWPECCTTRNLSDCENDLFLWPTILWAS